MFEARLVQSSILKKVLEAMNDLLKEALFECNRNGIQVQAMDSSHVSLVSLQLRSDGFDNYSCPRPLVLGISLSSITKIMKYSSSDDILTIRAEDDPDKVTIIFESNNHEKISDYEMRLMNLDQDQLGIPDTDYSCIIDMPSAEFSRICKDMTQFGESVIISCSKEGVKFSVSGDLGAATVKLAQRTNDNEEGVNIEVHEPLTLTFALRYLNIFTKATPLSKRVILRMASNVPLLVDYQIGDIGYLRYYLAPKFDDEEN